MENFHLISIPTLILQPNSQEAVIFAKMLANEARTVVVRGRGPSWVLHCAFCLFIRKAEASLYPSLSF